MGKITRNGTRLPIVQHPYEIPLSCSGSYVGQTGRCINMSKHCNLLPTGTGENLSLHCKRCGCDADFQGVSIMGREHGKLEREIGRSSPHRKLGADLCVSEPSVHLNDKETKFLTNH